MTPQEAIPKLELEWDIDEGFLGSLRQRVVDVSRRDRFLDLLGSIELAGDKMIPRRFLELIWYIPIFLEWQEESCVERGYPRDDYRRMKSSIIARLEETIGYP